MVIILRTSVLVMLLLVCLPITAAASDTTADTVLGQPGFTTSSAPNTANGMSFPIGVAIDPKGRLYVADVLYHRVLVFDNPASGDTTADTVYGQPGFTTSTDTTTASGMNRPTGLAFDSQGRLYVAEQINNRVLIFDNPPNDTTADTVLGQPGFTTSTSAVTANGLNTPHSLAFDAQYRLYVVDRAARRVLIFDNPANDTTADTVLGQPSFTSNSSATTANGMNLPFGVAVDAQGHVYVTDDGGNRVLLFDNPLSGDTTADTVYGQPGFTTSTATTTANGLSGPTGIALDSQGRLYVADLGNNRVLIFANPVNDTTADTVLGQPGFTTSTAATTANGMSSPRGMAFDTAGRLYVAESGNNRILIFDPIDSTSSSSSRVSQTTRSNNHQRGQILTAMSLPFEFTGKDTNGTAVSGRAPTYSVSAFPSGATGYSLDTMSIATTSSTGTAGVRLTLGDKNGVYQVTVTIDDTNTVFTAYTDSINIPAKTWTMFGPNKNPTTATRAGVIEDDGFGTHDSAATSLSSGYVVYWSNPAISPDSAYGLFVTPSTIDTGRSYWLYSASAKTLDVDGTVLTDTVSIQISPGWNMVSNPFAYFIDFDSDVQFQVGATGTKKSPQLAQTDSVADGVIFWYDNANTTFRLGPRSSPVSSTAATASSLQLKPFVGYEIYAHQTCTMHFYPNPRDPASSTVLNQTPAPRYQAAERTFFSSFFAGGESTDWEIQLTSSGTNGSQSVSDIDNYVGVRAAGSLTVRDAPAPPSGGMSLSVSPYGAGSTYALHYATSLAAAAWDVSSYSSSGGNVTITASGISGLPSSVSMLLLQDLSTGTVTDLKTSSYTYASGAGETRKLYLSANGNLPSSSGATKVLYPTACLIMRAIDAAPFALHPEQRVRAIFVLRYFRDTLLNSPIGRAAVSLYYR